ncbi:MAG: hypothetical protein LBT32_07280 [Peptococcaceae bacterium]|jgi:hypothetical protein|nr:hypothetical protein [Peptococcaceae bacterium]
MNTFARKRHKKARQKKFQVLSSAIILLIFISFGVWSFCDQDQEISVLEKRTLAQQPAFSLAALFSGEYTRGYETYYADNFPQRDRLINLSSVLNYLHYFDFGQNTVIVDRRNEGGGESLAPPEEPNAAEPETSLPESIPPNDDELIQTGSILLIGDRAMEAPYTAPSQVTHYAATISRTQQLLPDCRTISLIIPNAAEFYSPEKFHTGSYAQKDMITSAYAQMDDPVFTIDAYTALRKTIDQYIYFRTDHHWTALGAYQAYLAYCASLGFAPVPLEAFQTGVYENFVGSMYGWTSNLPQAKKLLEHPDTVQYYVPIAECTAAYYFSPAMTAPYPIPVVDTELFETSNKYLCFIRGDTPLCQIITNNTTGRKCIVIKESYGNAFVPFLTSHYDEVYVVDPRLFNCTEHPTRFNLPEFVRQQGINDIVYINYAFIPNNESFIRMLDKLLGQ